MKIKLVTIIIVLLSSFNVSAQKKPVKEISIPEQEKTLTNSSDTLQYTIGAFIGTWIKNNGFAIDNPALFKKGMDDVLQDKPLAVTDSTIVPRIAAYQLSIQGERSRQLEEQLFEALKGKPGVGVLPDGVHYIIIKEGTGVRPTASDTIVFNAIGVFPDGTLFEDTFKKEQPIKTLTTNLIPGLSESIQLMPEGSVWRIFIPSVLAYGTAGFQNIIPPNTALVFDITLMEVRKGE